MKKVFTALLSASSLLCAEESTAELLLKPEILEAPVSEIALYDSLASQPISLTPSGSQLEPPAPVKKNKSPLLAAGLSTLIPGLGHYYLGDFTTGSEILGGVAAGMAVTVASHLADRSVSKVLGCATEEIVLYGIYAAYRDARLYNGGALQGIPQENLKSLTAASFQWSVLKKPEVWGGFLGALTAALTVVYLSSDTTAHINLNTTYIEPLRAFPIAIGEESLFRGFLQTAFAESMPAWGAITCSSILFGAAHIPNAQQLPEHNRWRYYAFSIPFITCFGAYAGWVVHRNHSLKESVALHAWYDFTVMLVGAFASQAVIGKQETFLSHSIQF